MTRLVECQCVECGTRHCDTNEFCAYPCLGHRPECEMCGDELHPADVEVCAACRWDIDNDRFNEEPIP